jgi:hypothetical protein
MAAALLHDRPPRPFALGEELLKVRVRESEGARTTRIIVGPRRPLEVIVPHGVPDEEIDRLLERRRRWIAEKVAAARAIASRPAQLGLDGKLWLGGEPLDLNVIIMTAPEWTITTRARREGDQLIVEQVAASDKAADQKVRAAVLRWYRREARRAIAPVVEREAARLGLEFSSVAIRDQRTRWGSCSPKRNLSFSWRLVLAPPGVLEYVVVHELLHLREPNHSKGFWRLLDAALPGWQEQARWLRDHGQELHEYRPPAR